MNEAASTPTPKALYRFAGDFCTATVSQVEEGSYVVAVAGNSVSRSESLAYAMAYARGIVGGLPLAHEVTR